jgi:hypothetical protein
MPTFQTGKLRPMACAAFVPDYSGGSAVESNHLPFSIRSKRITRIENYSIVKDAVAQTTTRVNVPICMEKSS